MKYLLDTHAIIWYFENLPKIPLRVLEIIDTRENNVCLSSASLWEIAIKVNSGKLKLSFTLDKLLNDINAFDFKILQITTEYLLKLSTLPFIHKDPFDRLIVSSALAEDLTIITTDEHIQKYDVLCIW